MIRRSSQRCVLAFFLMACGAISTAVRADGELSRGERWVRSHPLTTMALTIIPRSFDPQQYKAANLTTTLAWKQRPQLLKGSASVGLPWHLNLRSVLLRENGLTDAIRMRLKSHHDNYKGCTGWIVWDEPNRSDMFIAAEAIKWLKETYPDTLVYSNAFPMGASLERYYGGKLPAGGYSYEQYLRDFAVIMDPDVIMYDAYIFREGGGTANPFPTMSIARKVALAVAKPYWSFVQSHSDERRGYRMPSESDLRMQVFAHLTSGYTGIAYFTYEDQQGPAMVSNATLERRPIYYQVARLNQEVRNVGQTLRFLKSTDVRYVPGRGNPVPAGATAWQPGAGGDPTIKSVVIEDPNAEPAEWRDVLIGFFRDDRDRDYFMLANLWHGGGASAAQRALTVTLTLDQTVTRMGRLSRETGRPETLLVDGDKFQVTLPGGTADLFRLGDAEFPGLSRHAEDEPAP